jgi:TolB-like protein/DNA-binding winged helix-turn-helix (wHTH) protein
LAGDFKVGDWLVSPALNQISGSGKSSRVEPKAMQVLVHLAGNPGVVNKDQLISAVWPDVFVSDDVLPGCVSALRKAFNDSARNPQVIGTIHKGGYRLLQPVEWLNGHRSDQRSAPQAAVKPSGKWRSTILALGLLAVLCFTFVAWTYSRPKYDSIAVLPFVNAGNDPDSAYLSDGIAEGVINDLSEVPQLKVMAWTTVSRDRNAQTDVRGIGRQLGVKSVLTGRLLRQGDHVVIQTELVDVKTGSQLWGQQYDRRIADILSLQEQLSEDIGAKLRVRLTGTEQKKILSRYSASPEAYQLYLKGRFFWNKRNKEGLVRAIDYFQRAIAIDPRYAVAYAGLADCYNLLDDWGTTRPRDSFPQARAAAEKALALDDSLAEAHTSLAMVRESYEWDWVGAEQEFKRAIELNPNYPTAHQWYGMFLVSLHRFSEAEAEVKRAEQLDPLSPIIAMGVGEIYAWERRYDEAIAQYRKVLDLDPSFAGAWSNLAVVYGHKQMYPEAVAALCQSWILMGEPEMAASVREAYARAGYPAVMRLELDRALRLREHGQWAEPIAIAEVYAYLGDTPNALKWVEKGYEEHSSSMQYLTVSAEFDGLKSTQEFQYWLKTLGLPASEEPTGKISTP